MHSHIHGVSNNGTPPHTSYACLSDAEDFVIVVEDSAGNVLDDVTYAPGSGDVELLLTNVDMELTLKVINPNYGSCEATQTFTIDCGKYRASPERCEGAIPVAKSVHRLDADRRWFCPPRHSREK